MNRTELSHLVKTSLKPSVKGDTDSSKACDWNNCIVCSYFLMCVFIQDYLSGIFNPEITQMLSITATHYGHLASLNLYTLAIFLVPTGLLFDRKPAKPLMEFAGVLITISAVIFWLAHDYWMIVISKIFCGMASSFAFVGGLRVIGISCRARLALATGIFFAIGNFSGVIASGPYIWLKEYANWRCSLLLNVWLSIGLMLAIRYFMTHLDVPSRQDNDSFLTKLKDVGYSLCDVAKVPNNWFCGIYAAIFYFPDTLFAGLWGFVYLRGKYGFSESEAGYIISFFIIGIALGSLLIGWTAERTKYPRLMMVIACLSCMILMWTSLHSPWNSLPFLMAIFTLLGILNCTEIMAFNSVQLHSPSTQASTALAFSALIMNFLNAVIQPIFGWQVERYWDGTWKNGAPYYTIDDLDHAMIIIPASFFVAAILACFIKAQQTIAFKS